MKPRTKLQRQVAHLSSQLPALSEDKKKWAIFHCLPHVGYSTTHRVICLECGQRFTSSIVKDGAATCPHCNSKLRIERSACRNEVFRGSFAIATVKEGFQVIRHFRLFGSYGEGRIAQTHCYEVLQCWILSDGKYEFIGKIHNTQGYCDSWHGDWEIRSKNSEWKYDLYVDKFHPSSRFKPEYRKYGFNSKFQGLTFLKAIKLIPTDSRLETLLKAGQYDMLEHQHRVASFWPSVKICMRNKYVPSDTGMWFDYLELLSGFQKDLRNPKYVCPRNLQVEHDRYVEKEDNRRRMLDLERKKQLIAREQPKYEKRIKKFLGLQFSKGEIIVKPLQTVMEFYEESRHLKHCVFANDYYKRADSLILSARIKGVPIETIEVSLSKMQLVQSRGIQNKPSEYNKEIVALVQQSLPEIRKVYRKKTA